MTGISMARSTRSGTGLGPGICRKWRPWCCVTDSSSFWLPNILHSIFPTTTHKLCTILVDAFVPTAYVPVMKPLIPDDTTPQVLDRTERTREDQSLHDEILTRLRDHIVEGNIPDGGRVPERQLCEMLKISRTPLREALKVLRPKDWSNYCPTAAPACGN